VVWVVSSGEVEANTSAAAEYGLEMPVLHVEGDVFETYKIPGVPYVVLIDEEGKIVHSGFGVGKDGAEGTLRELVEKARGGEEG